MKRWLLISWLAIIFSGIAFLFWHNEWKYSLPTPVPANYEVVKTGTIIDLDSIGVLKNNKPVFLHFFNPDCPCSRFNITHFKSLIKKYGRNLTFAVVVLNKNKGLTIQDIQDRFGLDIPVLFDPSIAVACGVYSTPQAVIIDNGHKLYYRGNYNKSRYCTDSRFHYAQMAIDSLLHNSYNIIFSEAAIKSYGCSLPNCTR